LRPDRCCRRVPACLLLARASACCRPPAGVQ
jgi:hypothetical protein